MSSWGRGLLQSEDDDAIAADLADMLGCKLLYVQKEEVAEIVQRLNDGLLSQKFDKILSANFKPATSYHKRERIVVILGMLAMQLGAEIESRHLTALRVLRPWLHNLEQQLQLATALQEYKNDGTPWMLGSKDSRTTDASRFIGKTEYDLGDEFWFSGLG